MFKIDYFEIGSVKRNDLYGMSPFIVDIDSTHLQSYDTEFQIQFKDDKSIILSISDNKVISVRLPATEETFNVQRKKIEKVEFKLNDFIQTEFFKFKIQIILFTLRI